MVAAGCIRVDEGCGVEGHSGLLLLLLLLLLLTGEKKDDEVLLTASAAAVVAGVFEKIDVVLLVVMGAPNNEVGAVVVPPEMLANAPPKLKPLAPPKMLPVVVAVVVAGFSGEHMFKPPILKVLSAAFENENEDAVGAGVWTVTVVVGATTEDFGSALAKGAGNALVEDETSDC